MAKQTHRVWHLHTTKPKFSTYYQTMKICSLSYSELCHVVKIIDSNCFSKNEIKIATKGLLATNDLFAPNAQMVF
jgi:hypothetical protein